jgi:hypothetical protein
MSAEGIDAFALPGATLYLAARTMWAIARVRRDGE